MAETALLTNGIGTGSSDATETLPENRKPENTPQVILRV